MAETNFISLGKEGRRMTRDGRDLIVFLLLTVLLMGGIMILKPGQGTLPAADVTTTATPKQQAK